MNGKIFLLTLTLITTSLSGMDKNQEKVPASSQVNAERELIDAASKDDLARFSQLLQTPGINVNAADSDGKTALFIAAWKGNTEIVRLLLDTPGIDINTHRAETGDTPLIAAAKKGHTEIVRQLPNKPGIEINASSFVPPGTTALMWAAFFGRTEAAQVLINKGANINARAGNGQTALMEAARTGRKPIAELLLDLPGINYNARTGTDNTALAYAAENNYIEIIKALLDKPNIDDESLQEARNIANNLDREDIVKLINAYSKIGR